MGIQLFTSPPSNMISASPSSIIYLSTKVDAEHITHRRTNAASASKERQNHAGLHDGSSSILILAMLKLESGTGTRTSYM